MILTKICIKCNCEKPLPDFFKGKTSIDGFFNLCKSCRHVDLDIFLNNLFSDDNL